MHKHIYSGCLNTKGNLSLTSPQGVKRNLSSCITPHTSRLYTFVFFLCVCQSICLHHSACHMMLDLSHHAPLTTRSLRAPVFRVWVFEVRAYVSVFGNGVSELLGATKTHTEPTDSNATDIATNRKLLTFFGVFIMFNLVRWDSQHQI